MLVLNTLLNRAETRLRRSLTKSNALGPKGSVFAFNSHLFHSGTLHTTRTPRKALRGYYTWQDLSQQAALAAVHPGALQYARFIGL